VVGRLAVDAVSVGDAQDLRVKSQFFVLADTESEFEGLAADGILVKPT
jgi:hypothetical protein